jgi:tRNA(adenine34) deaminase
MFISHETYMRRALDLAREAGEAGEIPVGAVIVKNGEIVGLGRNSVERDGRPFAHAEINAIDDACERLGTKDLGGCCMYVTLEPCPMCSGAIVLSRRDRLFIGARDPKTGACVSLYNIVEDPRLNHRLTMDVGLLEEECAEVLREFFRQRRKQKAEETENR